MKYHQHAPAPKKTPLKTTKYIWFLPINILTVSPASLWRRSLFRDEHRIAGNHASPFHSKLKLVRANRRAKPGPCWRFKLVTCFIWWELTKKKTVIPAVSVGKQQGKSWSIDVFCMVAVQNSFWMSTYRLCVRRCLHVQENKQYFVRKNCYLLNDVSITKDRAWASSLMQAYGRLGMQFSQMQWMYSQRYHHINPISYIRNRGDV